MAYLGSTRFKTINLFVIPERTTFHNRALIIRVLDRAYYRKGMLNLGIFRWAPKLLRFGGNPTTVPDCANPLWAREQTLLARVQKDVIIPGDERLTL